MDPIIIDAAGVRVERECPSGGWLLRALTPTCTMRPLTWLVMCCVVHRTAFMSVFCPHITSGHIYGVTCWEVFTCGRVPYTGVPAMTLLTELHSGHRLERPTNAACSDQMYVDVLRYLDFA